MLSLTAGIQLCKQPQREGRAQDCTLGESKGLKQSERVGDAQPAPPPPESVCMLLMEGELTPRRPPPDDAKPGSSPSAMFSRLRSVAMVCPGSSTHL